MNRPQYWKLILIASIVIFSMLVIYPITDTEIETLTVVDYYQDKILLRDKREVKKRVIENWGAFLTRFFHREFEREIRRGKEEIDPETGYKKLERVLQVVSEGLNLGLDLRGGSELVYRVRLDIKEKVNVNDIIQILRNRIDAYGLKEPRLQAQGADRILVQIPAKEASDVNRMKEILENIGHLEFRLVCDVKAHLAQWKAGKIPAGHHIYLNEGSSGNERLLIHDEILLTGEELASAGVNPVGTQVYPEVSLTFTPTGRMKFYRITKENVGKRLAIILNDIRDERGKIIKQGKLYSAPVIKGAIPGNAVIEGRFSMQEAQDLANVLRAGSLPVALELEHERTVGPGLGEEAIISGEKAVIIAMGLVVLFISCYYLFAGLLATLALFMNLLIVLSILALFDATLTLPGIAGLVLTVGMAVDANVLILERIKEERRKRVDKPLSLAIRDGYGHAFWTIFDANITTLITALILYWIGTGPIKGFAVTLSIGIVASMFSAIFVTRAILDEFLRKKLVKKLKMFHLFENPNLNVIGYWVPAAVLSATIIVLGMSYVFYRGAQSFDVDFRGGTLIHIAFKEPIKQETIIKKIREVPGLEEAEVQTVHPMGGVERFAVRESPDFEIRTTMVSGAKFARIEKIPLNPFAGGTKLCFSLKNRLPGKEIEDKLKEQGYNCSVTITDKRYELRSSTTGSNALISALRAIVGEENLLDTPKPERVPEDPFAGGTLFEVSASSLVKKEDLQNQFAHKKGRWQIEVLPSSEGAKFLLKTDIPDRHFAKRTVEKVFNTLSVAGALGKLFVDELAPPGIRELAEEDGYARYEISIRKTMGFPTSEQLKHQLEEKWGFKDTEVKLKEETPALAVYEISVPKEGAGELRAGLGEIYDLSSPFPRVEKIGPQVAREMLERAFLALVLSWIAIVAYMWFRFQLRFGVAAVVALIHDALITIIAIVVTNRPIDLTIIAAILTVIGYSLNDTIVIFDRIRENLRILRRESFGEIVNLSVNQTLNRTLLTSLTTLLAVVSLYIWGGGALEDFAFAMIIGVFTGTYSTIYVASPILYAWYARAQRTGRATELSGRRI